MSGRLKERGGGADLVVGVTAFSEEVWGNGRGVEGSDSGEEGGREAVDDTRQLSSGSILAAAVLAGRGTDATEDLLQPTEEKSR